MTDIATRPLLKGKTLQLPDISPTYTQLLTIEADAQNDLYIGHIHIDVDDTTSEPLISIYLNGEHLLSDFKMLTSSFVADFGRHILLHRVDKSILVEIKKTATGAGTLTVSAYVDGVKQPK